MESASSSEPPPHPPSHRIAHLLGAAVALLTLTLPLVAISHFSSMRPLPPAVEPYPFSPSANRSP